MPQCGILKEEDEFWEEAAVGRTESAVRRAMFAEWSRVCAFQGDDSRIHPRSRVQNDVLGARTRRGKGGGLSDG